MIQKPEVDANGPIAGEQSRIFKSYLLITLVFLTALWIVDLLVRFTTAPLWFLPCLIILQLVNLALFRWNERLVPVCVHFNFLIIFLVFQGYLIINPLGFHKLIFWTGVIPLLVVVILSGNSSIVWFVVTLLFLIGNGLIIQNAYPEYPITSDAGLLIISGIAFSVATMTIASFYKKFQTEKNALLARQNGALLALKTELQHNKSRLETYIKSALEFSERPTIINGDFTGAVAQGCALIQEKLGVSQVSFWEFNENKTLINCRYMFPEGVKVEKLDLTLTPIYAAELRSRKIIAASEARRDMRTKEFLESYLIPNNIHSLLDIPILVDGQLFGIICCENTYEIRRWSGEDMLFVNAIANILTITFKAELIIRMNNELDRRVKERTHTLKVRNDQLKEYAFINAHLLRGPLSSILGLTHLMEQSRIAEEEAELVEHLKLAGDQLDGVIRQINQMLGHD